MKDKQEGVYSSSDQKQEHDASIRPGNDAIDQHLERSYLRRKALS